MSGPLSKPIGRQRKWSPQEVALVERLRSNGLTYGQIACNLGVSKSAIISLYRNRIDPVPYSDAVTLRWRIRQLLTAGYSPHDICAWIGAPLPIAMEEFTKMEVKA